MRQVDFYKKDLQQVIWKVNRWIKASYPQYSESLSNYLVDQYETLTGEPLVMSSIDPSQFKKLRH
jgi:hypothetical protein